MWLLSPKFKGHLLNMQLQELRKSYLGLPLWLPFHPMSLSETWKIKMKEKLSWNQTEKTHSLLWVFVTFLVAMPKCLAKQIKGLSWFMVWRWQSVMVERWHHSGRSVKQLVPSHLQSESRKRCTLLLSFRFFYSALGSSRGVLPPRFSVGFTSSVNLV